MAHERTCLVCGTKYSYCPNCSEYANLEPWHYLYHDSNCMEIFNICSSFVGNGISADEAKTKLDNMKLPKNLSKNIQRDINKIKEAASSSNNIIVEETKKMSEVVKVENNSEENKSEEISTDEQLSPIKGFRKRRLERQKKNEEN